MICKLEIYNRELNIFPVVTNEKVFAQITMSNIVKGEPGDSAYQVAVENGFEGTEQEWLKFLHGLNGKSPFIGENGNWWVYDDETQQPKDTGLRGSQVELVSTFTSHPTKWDDLIKAVSGHKVLMIEIVDGIFVPVINVEYDSNRDQYTLHWVASKSNGSLDFKRSTIYGKSDGTIGGLGIRVINYLTSAYIRDNLTTNTPGYVLDAHQGKVLKDTLDKVGRVGEDTIDLGTSELPMNLNTPAGVRPTVQEEGQTGETANKIAYLSDLEGISGGVEVIKIIGLDPSWEFNYYIDVEENNKVINCMENGIPFIFQMWVGFGGNPYSYISKYFFPIEWNVMNDKYIIYYNDLGLYEMGDERKSSIKLNLNLTFEKNKTERYQIGSSTNALIDLRYGNQGVEGYKFLADDGTYKEIPASGSDVEVIKLSELFNSSPSVLIEQTWIFPEENTKLFKALEDGKTIILALYSGSNPSSPYESLRTVCGNPLINHISDTKIEITVEILSVWGGKMNVGNLKLGPFIKGSNDHYVVNFNSGSESTTITLNKSGDGTKFLSDNGNYVSVLPTGGTEGQILKIVDGNPKWVDPS